MRDFRELSINIKSADIILDDLIVKAKQQGAKNFDMLFTLKDGLNELSQLLTSKKAINDSFIEKWNVIIGWAPRVFEEHPLLEIVRKIDEIIIKR